MRKLIGFLLMTLPFYSYSQSVEIYGNGKFFANEPITISSVSNLISKSYSVVNTQYFDEDGNYSFSFEIKEPQIMILKIEMRELRLMVHPGSNFEIDFLAFENADNQRVPLRISFKDQSNLENIAQPKDYQNLEFEFAEYQSQLKPNQKVSTFYKSFFDSTDKALTPLVKSDTLFNEYYTYFKANSYLQSEVSKAGLFNVNIRNKYIQYSNPEYLKFFEATVMRRIHKVLSQNTKLVENATQEYQVYKAFVDLLKQDSLLDDEEIRNLGLLLYCMKKETNPILSKSTKNGIINQMSNFCPYPPIKKAAFNFQEKNNRYTIGNEAPELNLQNANGDYRNLSDFRGKPVYLGFINSKSRTCVRDLQIVNATKRKFRKARFVFVICDRDSLQMQNLPEQTGNISYLYLNKEYNALEDYQVWNFPVYYLLDKHGYFLQSPAKNPEGIIEDLQLLLAPKSSRKQYEIIKD